jgi:hypothetical protein
MGFYHRPCCCRARRAFLSTWIGYLGASEPWCDRRPSQCRRGRHATLFVGFDCVDSFRNGAKYTTHCRDCFIIRPAVCGSLRRWRYDRGRIERTVPDRPLIALANCQISKAGGDMPPALLLLPKGDTRPTNCAEGIMPSSSVFCGHLWFPPIEAETRRFCSQLS